jgi:HNH endonuclease
MFVDLILGDGKKRGWHELRFIRDDKKLRVSCAVCAVDMWLPKSKAGKYKTCGGECAKALREAPANARRSTCKTCSNEFIPRPAQLKVGGGIYCSVKCSEHLLESGRTKEARAKSGESIKRSIANGSYIPARGKDNPLWMGGLKGCIERRIASGKAAESLKKYRRANPDIARSFSDRRLARKGSAKLPKGTITKIGDLQRWFCIICKEDLQWSGYHIDHIVPLARGGAHNPENIQLLCPTCNVRKSAKDPIDYMQERGFLL